MADATNKKNSVLRIRPEEDMGGKRCIDETPLSVPSTAIIAPSRH